MNKIIFILGGARSGKSSYAIRLAKEVGKQAAFIATCLPLDEEMKERINLHKKGRPSAWRTFEEPEDIAAVLMKIGANFKIVIIDCLTLWLSNLISAGLDDNAIEDRAGKIFKALKAMQCKSIIVSNEVGLGIIPSNPLARRFRDLAGRINQLAAGQADEVVLMQAGIPVKIKSSPAP